MRNDSLGLLPHAGRALRPAGPWWACHAGEVGAPASCSSYTLALATCHPLLSSLGIVPPVIDCCLSRPVKASRAGSLMCESSEGCSLHLVQPWEAQ